jgi:glutamate/aspartate transport system permease protein
MFAGFDFMIIIDSIPFLLEGMWLTLQLTVSAIVGGLFFGTILAMCRLAPNRVLSFVAGSYVNFFRSMPLILVIFWFYFSVLVAFVLFEAAYYCEIMRAGISSVRSGQVYAGQALGLTYRQNMRYIVLPQAFRNMVPILLTQAIILFQDTSLVYVVGLRDFLVAADVVANRDNRLLEMFTTVALVYFVLCLAGSLYARRLNRKYTL